MTILGLLNKVKTVDLRAEVPKIIQKTGFEATALNQEQLYDGFNTLGERLLKYRSDKYASYKASINPKPGFGNPDLFLTGAFYKGMNLLIKGDSFEINSTDSKTDSLVRKYGEKIFGLSKESKSEYSGGVVFEEIKQYITAKTGLKFG